MPRCRILAVGDELLLGRVIDTNSAFLARWAGDQGLEVVGVAVVGDAQARIEAALTAAIADADLVLVSGGLGPTEDDRTRHALAAVLGAPLREEPRAWLAIERAFRRFGRKGQPPASNRRQALFPRGSDLLTNDRGTAPGILARSGRCRIACFPGVPHEMEAMALRLGRRLGAIVPRLVKPVVRELYLAGVGESSVQDRIEGLLSERRPMVGITASELGHLCLRVVGERGEVVARVAELRRRLREYVLPAPGLAASLVRDLGRRGATFSAAESCTAGHVVAQLAAIPGASTILRESQVTYHEDAKRRHLGVPAALIRRHGVVSQAVAEAMARGQAERSGATLAVATTGVAGPGGGTAEAPVGTVWMAAVCGDRILAHRASLRGSRTRIQARGAAQALLLAWQVLQGRV